MMSDDFLSVYLNFRQQPNRKFFFNRLLHFVHKIYD
ncbi:MAG: hypothetical protein PWQ53_1028, partial [Bacteroidota bacterium]|nr:hypothetical protein [Dysgonamonadaceae bacterium]MDN5306369.1 hypothetical protein [Bacteroidota bacterium]